MSIDNLSELDPREFIRIAPITDLPVGERIFLELDGNPIVLFNLAGEYFAIGDLCTHDHGPLGDGKLEGREVICPRHGARFDLASGKATRLPAVTNIPTYPVRVLDGHLEIGLPRK